jgi:hypothetical protein
MTKLRLVVWSTCALAGCGTSKIITGDPPGQHEGGGPDLAMSVHKMPPTTNDSDGGSVDPSADMDCGGMAFAIQVVPPNVMLILDRSGSMNDSIDGFSNTSKWDDLHTAMTSVLGQYDAQIRFGADLFSDPNGQDSCAPGPIAVPVGPNHGAMIQAAMNATMPGNNTPTAATFDQVIQNGMLNDPTRDNFVVIATDGLPNCTDTDVTSRITTLYNQKPSVKTYVIGVGAELAGDPLTLDLWAAAGHTSKGGLIGYYQASSPQDLQSAFNAIVGGVVSCTFKMDQAAPDPMQLYVWSNGMMVPADPNNGYSYDPNGPSVTLHGASCDKLRSDPNTKIQVVYGCPNPPGIG